MARYKYITVDEDGVVIRAIAESAERTDEDLIDVSDDPRSAKELARCKLVDGELYNIQPLEVKALADGMSWQISGCPEYTVVTIYDVSGGEVLESYEIEAGDPDIVVTLQDPGEYQIHAKPPHGSVLPVTKDIKVHDA